MTAGQRKPKDQSQEENVNRLRRRVLILIFACMTLSFAKPLDAGNFDIANGDVTALVNTISICQINNADDTINLAANGTYFLTRVDNTTVGPSGLPVITGDNGQHSLTIHGNGATITRFGNAPASASLHCATWLAASRVACPLIT